MSTIVVGEDDAEFTYVPGPKPPRAPPRQPPPPAGAPPPAAQPRASADPPADDGMGAARWSLGLGIAAWALLPLASLFAPFYALSILAAVGAIATASASRRAMARTGATLGRTAAIVGLVLGIVHVSLAFVVPLLFLLVCCIACGGNVERGPSSSSDGGGSGCSCCTSCGDACDGLCSGCAGSCGVCGDSCASCGDACDGCAGSCGSCGSGCGNCGCGDCGCGSGCGDCGCGSGCGDCGCGDCGTCDCGCGDCGGCGCAAIAAPPALALAAGQVPDAPQLSPRAAALDRRFAHHPRGAAYAQDVYVVRGVRLCIGCFTTYPVFLALSAILAVAPLPWTPGALMTVGGIAALAQLVSSAGWAKRRWMKATVKTLLGGGMALLLHGTLASGLPKAAQVAILLGLIAASSLSALPRALRMRAASRCSCEARAPQEQR